MKKKLMKALALALAVVLLAALASTAFATDEPVMENDLATIHDPITGATVEFASAAEDEEKILVTYTSEELVDGGYYMVLMVKCTLDEEGSPDYTVDQDSIVYIDQTTAAEGSISFTVYPSELTTGVILITGLDSGALVAAIVEGKYILGDVTKDGKIDSADAMLLLQYVAGLTAFDSEQELAGNVTGGEIDSADAMLLLQVVAGLAELN